MRVLIYILYNMIIWNSQRPIMYDSQGLHLRFTPRICYIKGG
jgi:hypothetical protein